MKETDLKRIKAFEAKLSSYVFREEGNKALTRMLFLDQSPTNDRALYSLQSWDRIYKGEYYPSIHRLYVDMEDLAEFDFANKYFDGYQHWLEIKSCEWFKEPYKKMVEELNAKIRGRSLSVMMEQMRDGTASQATLKYLADNDYIPKNPVGKPKRSTEKKAELHVITSDLARMKS